MTPAGQTTPTAHVEIDDAEIFAAHRGGKLGISSLVPLAEQRDLSISYTPGVARVCEAIRDDVSLADTYTWASRTVAVISDGTAVLGLGDIGPKAALPVMEGKAQLFSHFSGLNAVPVVLDTTDTEEIIAAVKAIAPSFGAINLEDISAPRCFEIERRLKDELSIPVMHDDQHGTAVVATAGLRNAARLLNRQLGELKVVILGAGAAGVAITNMLLGAGVKDIIAVDSRGIIHSARTPLNPVKEHLARVTNPRGLQGSIDDALRGANVVIGVSSGRINEEQLQLMAADPILFPLANPHPEIDPELAVKYGAVVATGRSDYPNQINNVLAFPGIFRGAIDAGAQRITTAMKLAASRAIADCVGDDLAVDYIIPGALDQRVEPLVARAVHQAALNDASHSGATRPLPQDD